MNSRRLIVNPKLIIIDYYDSLIQQIDIYTEEKLKSLSDPDICCDEVEKAKTTLVQAKYSNKCFELEWPSFVSQTFETDGYKDPYKSTYEYDIIKKKSFVKNIKIRDQVNRIRDDIIRQIDQIRSENLEHFESIRNELKKNSSESEEETNRRFKKKLFEKKFCFIFELKNAPKELNSCSYDLYLILLDFYPDDNIQEIFKYLSKIFRTLY